MFFDMDGRPITVEAWEILFRTYDRVVARTEVGDQQVSTVWLGIDYSFGMGPPLIYETMIFPECEYCVRTPTRQGALAAHDQAVASLRRPVTNGGG